MSKDTYKILIDSVITDYSEQNEIADISEAFEGWTNSIILEPFDLSVDEIDAGLTEGGGDGQIDAMYVIANGALLSEDEVDIPSKGPIELAFKI